MTEYVEGNLLKSCGIHDNDYQTIKPHTLGGHNQQRMKSPPFWDPILKISKIVIYLPNDGKKLEQNH